jgi:hypothetical protein
MLIPLRIGFGAGAFLADIAYAFSSEPRLRPGGPVAHRKVKRGTTVRWVNQGENRHTTTSVSGLWDATLDPGEAFTRRFRKTGRFRYFCEFHDGTVGRMRVVA